MYVRFVTNLIDAKSHERFGVIRSASAYQKNMLSCDQMSLEELFGWFNDFLAIPTRLSRSKKRRIKSGRAWLYEDRNTRRALSWFKDSAKIYIRKARKIADLLAKYDVSTDMLTSNNPGYIIYEDEDQVAAIPFA